LSPGLALADHCDLPADDRLERDQMRRDKRDKHVASAQLALDFGVQICAGRERLRPDFERADLLGRLQMPGHKGKPLNLALDRLFRFVGWSIANENDRLGWRGRHGTRRPSGFELARDFTRPLANDSLIAAENAAAASF